MAGNDIVDLNQAAKESNWKRKGYLEKIFTLAERFMIHSCKDPEVMVWLLWTMKESAYKIHTRKTNIRTFAPALLCCNNLIIHEKSATGNVIYQDEVYFTKSTLAQKYIHTVAVSNMVLLNQIKLKIGNYDESDSSYRSTDPASVSHHGQYLALVYL